jgi:hypothetical protein
MSTSLDERHPRARVGQSAPRVVAVSAMFVAVLVTAWLVGRDFLWPGTRVPADIYRGVVQLPPNEQGRCERFEYDNRTGWMWPKGVAPCDDVTAALPSRSSLGSRGRMIGISDHFKGH